MKRLSIVSFVLLLFSLLGFNAHAKVAIPSQPMGMTYSGIRTKEAPTVASINQDIQAIQKQGFTTVRTYYPQYNGNLGLMPIFQNNNIDVLLGLYIFEGHNDWTQNNYDLFIKPYLKSGKNLTAVIVGNEDPQYIEIIKTYINLVKQDGNQQVAVSSAQTSDFWLNDERAQGLASICDFIAVNIYPAWDWNKTDSVNQPDLSVASGFDSVKKTYQALVQKYPGKQVVVTEVGWPTTYGYVVDVPKQPTQFQQGIANANSFFEMVKKWSQNEQIVVYYYSMFDDWYAVNTSSLYNFHFGRLGNKGQEKVPTVK